MEDRTWKGDPVYLERRRQTLADIRVRADALGVWVRWAQERIARLEREAARARTAELGHWEPNDEPL